MEARPELSVLIVSSGERESLLACLWIVRAEADASGAEVVLVVNAPPEWLSPALHEQLVALCDMLVFEPRPGKSRGLNRGVRLCRGSVIAFTDDDTLPAPGWLDALTEPLRAPERPPELVGCGGPVRPVYPGSLPAWYRRLVAGRRTHFLGPIHDFGDEGSDYAIAPDGTADCPIGANCAYRAELFATRQFDPSLGPNSGSGGVGGEDTAFGVSLLQQGWRLSYVPKAIVHHPVTPERLERDALRPRFFEQGRARVRVRRMLGLPLSTPARLRVRSGLARALRPLRRLVDPDGDAARDLRIAYWRGMLRQLREPAPPPPSGVPPADPG